MADRREDRSGKAPRRATLADVAARAQTSTITVSRALRSPDMVSEPLRRRIATAVKELGYVPNPAASALASRRSNVIGVLVPSISNNVFTDVLTALYDTVAATSFTVQLGNSRYDADVEEQILRVFFGQRPAGLIVAGIDQTEAASELLTNIGCPVVQIMELADDPFDMMVGFSHTDGAYAATDHLVAQGYRAPAFIGARMDPRSQRRLSGFRRALAAARIDPGRRIVTTTEPSSVALGGALLTRLLDLAPEADAVFCNNDDLALGVQFEAQRRGIAIGPDFGICGFNDLEAMSAAHPAITSIRTFRRDMGSTAARMILDRLAGNDAGPPVRDLGFRLMARVSTSRRLSPSGRTGDPTVRS